MTTGLSSPSQTPSRPEISDGFVATRWTLVLTARRSDTTRAHQALSELCQTYWFPLYSYVRRRGYDRHDAEDLTQGFFARLLKLNSLAGVAPGLGKFRAFLLASMKNHLQVERERAFAQKRDARQTFSFDVDSAETRYDQPFAETVSPELYFDRQWALTLLDKVIHQLREEYETSGRAAVFQELRQAITVGATQLPQAELALRLGMSNEAVRVAAHRLRKRYRQLLREEIAGTVADDAEIDAELDYLRRVIMSS